MLSKVVLLLPAYLSVAAGSILRPIAEVSAGVAADASISAPPETSTSAIPLPSVDARAVLPAVNIDALVDGSLNVAADASLDTLLRRSVEACAVAPTLDFSGSTWIWTGEQTGAEDISPTGARPFRKAIPSSGTKCPVCATIIISSDDLYSIVVNGNEIGAGNGYKSSAVYTAGLEPEGHNVFAISVNNTGGAAGLIATILVDYRDGTTQTIVTDTTWKTIKATPPDGWTSPSFDDSAWIAAVSEGPTASTPWGTPPLPPAMNMTGVKWIHTNETSAAGVDPLGHRPFRKTITSPYGKAAVCGKIVITADDEYTLYVNGNDTGSGSNWLAMQAYSIPILDADENLIAVDSVNTQPPHAGLVAGVLVAYDDGTSETYYTDDSWKTLDETTPAGFEDTDLDDSSWISATEWVNGEANLVTVPRA